MNNEMSHSETNPRLSDELSTETTVSVDETGDLESNIVLTVVENVADITDQELTEMPPLYDSINSGAVADLLSSPQSGGRSVDITFEYQGCRITASSDGTVTIRQLTA